MNAKRINGEGSIYPYPHGYRGYVWVTTPSGRRQRKYVTGKTREAVREKYLKLHELARRGPVSARVPTLAQFLEGWIEEVIAPTLAPATVASYRTCIRLYIVPELGGKRLEKLTVRDVQGWVNQLRVRCQCCAQGKDAARAMPECCAIGQCCHQLLADWTVHQAYAVYEPASRRLRARSSCPGTSPRWSGSPLPGQLSGECGRSMTRGGFWSPPATGATHCTWGTSCCWCSDFDAEKSSDFIGLT